MDVPVTRLKSPFVFHLSKPGAGTSSVSVNFARFTKIGTICGPTRSSQPRIGVPPGLAVHAFVQASSSMTLPSSQASPTSTTVLPQQPSPTGHSAAVTHASPLPVQCPTTVHVEEH